MLRLRGKAAVILSCTLLLLALISPAFASGPTDASAPAATAPAACTELLTNGDFEQQSASWTQAGAPGTELITEDNPRTGNYSAYLGGITNSDHSVRQQITLPAGQIITLKFWSYQNTLEHAPNMDDYLSVRLLRPDELPADWNPATDKHPTVWETTHHLLRVYHHEKAGDQATAELLRKLGARAEIARDLAYRLFSLCEKKKLSQEAQGYNALVLGWPEIARLACEQTAATPLQEGLFV